MKTKLFVLVTVVVLILSACSGLPGMKTQPTVKPTKTPTVVPTAMVYTTTVPSTKVPTVAPATIAPTVVPTAIPTITSASAVVDLGARLCDSDIALYMDDPKHAPTTVVGPGDGLVLSMDPGKVVANEREIISSDKGILLGFINDSTVLVTVTVHTGWNEPNQQWNVYLCRFLGSVVANQATVKQAEEKKPVFKVVAWSALKSSNAATPITATSTVAPAVTNCDSTGNWKGDLDVPATCVVWISMDAGTGEVSGVKFSFSQRATLVVYGPAKVKLASPPVPNVNHWMGSIGVVKVDNKDNASIAKQWKPGFTQLTDR